MAEAALAGDLAGAAVILVPRTSDADYKFFLYLREFARLDNLVAAPPVLLQLARQFGHAAWCVFGIGWQTRLRIERTQLGLGQVDQEHASQHRGMRRHTRADLDIAGESRRVAGAQHEHHLAAKIGRAHV